jgi:hypothetical protein
MVRSVSAAVGRFVERDRQKIGGMSLGASARLGLAELRQAFTIEGSIADKTPTPLGMYGALTPGEISAARQESTVHGPAQEAKAVDTPEAATAEAGGETQPSAETISQETAATTAAVDQGGAIDRDPVQAARRQVAASHDVGRSRPDPGLSR